MKPGDIEKLKLTGSLLNGVAIGFVVTGIVAPTAGVVLGTVSNLNGAAAVALTVIWLLIGIALHLVARGVVGRVK